MSRSLLVVGGGEVAAALEHLSAGLGWSCATTEDLGAVRDRLSGADAPDALVVLSHHDGTDAPTLQAALALPAEQQPGYVAAMGSRRTQARRREQLLASGLGEEGLAPLHAPAGLDLGADTPAEIALAILAEAVMVLRGRDGAGSLRDRPGPIHPELAPGEATCPG